MPTLSKAELHAKEIQKRAKEIADGAMDAREIEAQARVIELRAREIEQDVLSRILNVPRNKNTHGSDFSNKEVYLLLLDEMSKKLDKHIEFCDDMTSKYIPEFNKQSELLAQVCKDMPNKGFCEKVEKMHQDLYPQDTGEPSTPQKVNLLWNDRRWLKGLLYFLVGLGAFNAFITWFRI